MYFFRNGGGWWFLKGGLYININMLLKLDGLTSVSLHANNLELSNANLSQLLPIKVAYN